MVFSNITTNQYEDIIQKNNKVVLFFKTMRYTSKYRFDLMFDFISCRYPDIKIIEIDIEQNGLLADKFNIDFLPTSIFIYQQKLIHQENGIWEGGKNIIACFSNLIIHSELKNKPELSQNYKKKVEELNIKLMSDYSNFIKDTQ